jgi:hypothetical protein
MELEGPVPWLQEPISGSHPGPDESTKNNHMKEQTTFMTVGTLVANHNGQLV